MYKGITNEFNRFQCNHSSLLPLYLQSTSQSLLPSPLRPHANTSPNEPTHSHTLTQ